MQECQIHPEGTRTIVITYWPAYHCRNPQSRPPKRQPFIRSKSALKASIRQSVISRVLAHEGATSHIFTLSYSTKSVPLYTRYENNLNINSNSLNVAKFSTKIQFWLK